MSSEKLLSTAVSLYQNSFDRVGVVSNLCEIMEGIKSGKWQRQVEQVRGAKDRDNLKQKIPAFTASGLFTGRNANGLQAHSGRIAIDFDLQDNPTLETGLEAVRKVLQEDRYSEYVSLSVSGKGLFVIAKIDGSKHAESFTFLEAYYQTDYRLTIDKACKDVSRLRFVSYDPNLYHNENAETVIVPDTEDFGELTQEDFKTYQSGQNDNKAVMDAIIQSGKLIGDDSYGDWVKIGLALANTFGESGRQYFH
ncbi:MAG: BT4734/BF3469 family protein [Candidatus Jettenia sp. CY-1]|nr:MAG: BT4734/BF3469 family protein [Candidatus Jettenia sp. CY-1]